MMSAVSGSGDQLLRRVKQEAEPPPQYSPTEQLALASPPLPRPVMMPEVSQNCHQLLKQEAERPPQYSPTEQLALASPPLPRPVMMPEVSRNCHQLLKQEAERPPQYSPTEQLALASPPLPRPVMMPEVSQNCHQLLKQEAERPPQYSPTEQLALASPPLPRPVMMPEMELEPKEEVKYCVSPAEGVAGNTSPEQQHCSSTTAAAPSARDEDAPRRLCLVCGDVASGFHYGVASCEACKAFFKRTIQGNIEYTCPASNECEINKRRRKACQACRFRKCLRTGMLREGVRLDRVRGGRQKYRRAPDPPPQARPHLDDIKILEVLSSYEPEPFTCAAPPAGVTEPSARTLALLADLYDRELVGVISWAKQIPGFTDLQLNDQMRLLQSTWAEMLSLMLAYRSISNGSGTPTLRLRFATDLSLDEQQARELGAGELFAQVSGVARRLERAAALREECYLLKALVLANSEARIEEHAALRRFRDAILAALNDAVSALRPYNAGAALQQLLLVLPALRHADVAVRRYWAGVYRDRRAPMNKLFVEMLEACLR